MQRPEIFLQAVDSLLAEASEREEWERVRQLSVLQERLLETISEPRSLEPSEVAS